MIYFCDKRFVIGTIQYSMSITLEVICEGVDLFSGRMFNSLFTSSSSATTSIIPLHGSLAVNGHIW